MAIVAKENISFLYVAWPMAIIAIEKISCFYMWPGQWQQYQKKISLVSICGLANGNNSKRKYLSFLYVAWPIAIIAKLVCTCM